MDLTLLNILLIVAGGFFAGFVNAIAGGGTLISFPALTFTGIPFVSANITSSVSLSPGYLAATFAQLHDLKKYRHSLRYYIPIAALGGILGGYLLLISSDKVFKEIVPYLILLACALLYFQDKIKTLLAQFKKNINQAGKTHPWTFIAIFFAAIYGGYFGAGLSVIVLSILALSVNDDLTKLNALKQIIGFATNMCAAVFFMFTRHVVWKAVLIMAMGAIAGGWTGGKFAGMIKPISLRYIVVVTGLLVSVFYFIKY
ncbi:MAG: sulfite exporter TauE/SafE family protein [Bacteroidales bacterium]